MSLHGIEQLLFGGARGKAEGGIERVEFEEIAMGTARRTGTYNTQCTHVPAGASGSSTISANDPVPAGGSFHVRAGEMFLPVQVYFAGMDCPLANASLLISIDIAASVASFVDISVGVSLDEQDESTMTRTKQKKRICFIRVLLASLHRIAG